VKIENGCAIINFSNEFLNYENEENKLKIINSIVNTLTNLKEINSIKILINGKENENLLDEYCKIK
jgi:spore germination protein GerM